MLYTNLSGPYSECSFFADLKFLKGSLLIKNRYSLSENSIEALSLKIYSITFEISLDALATKGDFGSL